MASQYESVGKTPPLIIHDILGTEIGGMPHRHSFATFRSLPSISALDFGKQNKAAFIELYNSLMSDQKCLFFCQICFVICTTTTVSSYQSTSNLDGCVSSCDRFDIHHFHREQNRFNEVSTSDRKELATSIETPQPLRICCCRCNYRISICFSLPPISQKNLSLLYQINPDSIKYLKSLYLLSSILSKNLEDSPKSLKLNGVSFKAVFPDLEKAKEFFENLGYKTVGDFLVPIPLIWANKKLIFLAWAQILLEIVNQRLAFDDIEQSQTVYEDGEKKLLGIFGSNYSKSEKRKEINPFEIPPSELSSAYFGLGCISDMPDTLLWSIYELLQEEIPNFRPLLFDFIIEIASDRQSELLQEKIGLARSNGEFSQSELKEAFLHFGFDESEINSINELAILKSYQGLVETKPDELGEHLTKLKLLAFAHGAKSIEKFLETGEIPSDLQVRLPIGLDNIGNTCYLNSLLQYYYSVKFLRDQVLSFSSDSQLSEQETALNDQSIEIDNRKISPNELSLAKFFVKHLKVLFHKLETENLQPYIAPSRELAKMALGNMDVSISNNTPPNLPSRHSSIDSTEIDQAQGSSPGGNISNLASADPILLSELNDILPEAPNSHMRSSTPGYRSPSLLVDSSHEHLQDNLPDNPLEISVEEGNLYDHNLEASSSVRKDTTLENHSELPTVNERECGLTVSSSPSNDLTFGSQQDVSECMDHIMWQLEKAFATRLNSNELKKDKNIIKDLFYGKTCQTLKYKDSRASKDVSSTKEEEFSHLIINVLKSSDIYDGLDEYFQKSIVELDNTQAVRELSISKAPPFLQIQLQRVQFDRETLQVYKSNEFLKLYDKIYVDRYLVDSQNDPEMIERFANMDREKASLESAIGRHLLSANSYDRLRENGDNVENPSGQLTDCSETQVEHQVDKILDLGATSSTTLLNGSAPSNDAKEDVKPTGASEDKVESMNNFDTVTSSQRLSELQSELESLHSKYLQAQYSLHAVLIHKGTANYGHYWVYIKDWMKNTWFRYNDEYVSTVPESEIFTDTTGLVANPYYVIYIKTSRIPDLLECAKEIQG